MKFLNLFFIFLFSFSLSTHAQESETQPDPSTFQDPFGSEPSTDQAPAEISPVDPPIDTPAQMPVGPGSILPSEEPSIVAPETAAPSDSTNTFEFPELDKEKGPVTQEIVERENFSATRTGRWNMGGAFGAGFNFNRRHSQFHIEANGGYRLTDKWEVGGVLSYRTVKDQLIGMIALAKWIYPLKLWSGLQGEILPQGGLGWSLRMKPNGKKFTEGRGTLRLGGELLVYAMPDFAITTTMAMESFLFLIDSDTGSQSLFKNGGPPTQLLLTVGGRWQF